MFELFFIIFYVGFIMYLANMAEVAKQLDEGADGGAAYEDRDKRVRVVNGLLYTLAFLMFMLALMSASVDVTHIPSILAFILMVALAILSYKVIQSLSFRQTIQGYVASQGRYDATSSVHTTAIVLSSGLFAAQLLSFVMQGGIDGIAESIGDDGVPVVDLFLQALLQVTAAFLGVGWAIRRTLVQTLSRLGLRMPTRDDISRGLGTGISLIFVLWLYGVIMTLLTSAGLLHETQNDAANELAMAFSTVPLALLLATLSAVGEEVLFRGALQPIFGNLLVSILFALIHTQLLFTPGMVLIFVVSYGFGRVRDRYSTTAAIISHFIYNFIQLLLLIVVTQAGI